MVSEKRHHRSHSSLGRFSFVSCFTGATVAEDCHGPAPRSYEKLSTAAPDGQKKPPAIQLGGKAPPNLIRKTLSFSSVVSRDSKVGLGEKVKEACEQALEVAKKSTPHISELFVGGQFLMHVTPGHVGHKLSKQKTFSPSIGFLHMAAPNMDASPKER